MKLRLFGKEKGHTFMVGFGKHWHPMACDRIRLQAMACDRFQSQTFVSVSDSEDEAEHLDDPPRYHVNHREDGMSHCIEHHEEKTKYHHSILDFQFNLRPLTKPNSIYKVTKNF